MTITMNGEPFLSIQAADHTSNEAATGKHPSRKGLSSHSRKMMKMKMNLQRPSCPSELV